MTKNNDLPQTRATRGLGLALALMFGSVGIALVRSAAGVVSAEFTLLVCLAVFASGVFVLIRVIRVAERTSEPVDAAEPARPALYLVSNER